jgi:hypothetical protein
MILTSQVSYPWFFNGALPPPISQALSAKIVWFYSFKVEKMYTQVDHEIFGHSCIFEKFQFISNGGRNLKVQEALSNIMQLQNQARSVTVKNPGYNSSIINNRGDGLIKRSSASSNMCGGFHDHRFHACGEYQQPITTISILDSLSMGYNCSP